ncbi:MAG: RNA methyltransferase, partial [Gelidibacter sp.]|nr:RNA methyltransferase [Gelidibacter sp.]
HHVFATESVFKIDNRLMTDVSEAELKKISNLKTPNTALALFKMPKTQTIDDTKLIVALDDIRDPGNLGTIIRLCDWFGVKDLVCSSTTVDCYNPKVVQATMGSLTRVALHYVDLEQFLATSKAQKFGAFMDGNAIYSETLPKQGILVLGNEANGISASVESLIDKKISIPRFGNLQATESLNVATATAVLLSEFRRHSIET